MTSPGATNIEQRLARYRRMFDLSGKKALVLGAASGIGKASAEAFFALGAVVICADIDRAGAEAAAAGIGGQAHRVDAGKSEDIKVLASQGGGSLIASSSVRASTLEPELAIYGATKAGIIQMVRGLASELGPHGVRVNAIVPSIVETPLVAPLKARPHIFQALAAHTVFNRWSEPSEVAAAVVFLASDAASYVTGSALLVDGGWTAIDGPPTGLTQTHSS